MYIHARVLVFRIVFLQIIRRGTTRDSSQFGRFDGREFRKFVNLEDLSNGGALKKYVAFVLLLL